MLRRMQMPPLDPDILARRAEIVAALRAIVPGEGVIDDLDGMRPYECDALSAYRQMPLVVVLPETVSQVAAILRYCQDHKVKVVPRGAGTSLSGGSMPVGDAILLGMGKFNRVLEIDYANRCAVVQPGVTNLGVTKAVEHEGFYYAPDPSSQIACSIGGNVAENSGGVHCLKYGLTTNNLLGIEMVLMTGEVVRLGGKHLDAEGYDLMGLMKRFIRQDLAELHQKNVRVRVIGSTEKVDSELLALIEEARHLTAENNALDLIIAFNYGSRAEITEAARRLAERVAESGGLAGRDVA